MKTKRLFLFIPLFIIMITSLYTMYTVKSINTLYNNYLIKQLIWYAIGITLMFVISKFSITKKSKIPLLLYICNVALLLLVLFFGKETNGAKAWFDLKFFSFQPSEIMKFTLTLYLAQIISKHKNNSIGGQALLITKIIFLILIPSILVYLEPDTGAIILYLFIGFAMLLTAKLNKWWYIISFIIVTILLSTFFYLYFKQQELLIKILGSSLFYRMDRIINFTNGNGFQIKNALIAIGSSELIRFHTSGAIYIPEAPTDFIIAYLINITGLIGLIIVLISYLFIDIYFIYLLTKEKNKQHKLFISGFLGMFLYQQLQNILMNVGLFPIMGIPLPFLSYGGTNIIVYFMFIGIIISKRHKPQSLKYNLNLS